MKGSAWIDDYEELVYESDADGEDDYVDELMSRTSWYDADMRDRTMSSSWSRGKQKSGDAEGVVHDLMRIRDTVHNLLKIHGMPKDTSVDLAMLGQLGKGVSGFDNVSGWENPHICLDKSVYDDCSSDEVLDVYCGIGLHEASHLNHTRRMFERLHSGELKGGSKRAMWEGLFEDERIEQLVRIESPGYAPYVQAVKRALFEKKEFGMALGSWEKLPDMDKVMALIFSTIRCPYLLTDEMREWKTIKGEVVFETLRRLFNEIPRDEDTVEAYGRMLESLWDRLRDDYDDATSKSSEEVASEMSSAGSPGDSEGSGGAGSAITCTDKPEGTVGDPGEPGEIGEPGEDALDKPKPSKKDLMDAHKRLLSQKKADKADAKDCEEADSIRHEIKKLSDYMSEHGAATASEASDGLVGKGWRSKAEPHFKKEAGKKKTLEKKLEKLESGREGRRFSMVELQKMLDRVEKVSSPLDREESKELAKATEERIRFEDSWTPPMDYPSDTPGPERRTLVIHPVPTKELQATYKTGVDAVRGQINRMRNVFRLRLGTRKYSENELVEGRLHRRRIGHAAVTDRVFQRKYTKVDRGISICLLLDESGSMGHVYNLTADGGNRAEVALKVAILIAESLKKVPGVELEIYSYASCGTSDQDCLIKYLYGKCNPNTASIAGYREGAQNYDHMAIKTAGDLFVENTTNDNRLMIVLSDGAPCGYMYGGRAANAATRKEVEKLEKRGIYVLNVAIESFASESMFKNVIRFLDLPDLTRRMRQLITRIIKDATG
jgi:hypothetical protein